MENTEEMRDKQQFERTFQLNILKNYRPFSIQTKPLCKEARTMRNFVRSENICKLIETIQEVQNSQGQT